MRGNSVVATSVVLRRTNYGEADRIVTVLTRGQGKVRLLAKGTRRIKSKLAGGVELFSEAQITYLPGKGELGTLMSARLSNHWSHIVEDIDRTMAGYDFIKRLDSITEDSAESEYYDLLIAALNGLNTLEISLSLTQIWFSAQLLKLSGLMPNLITDTSGKTLAIDAKYNFDFDSMAFKPAEQGKYGSREIKFLRLLFSDVSLAALAMIQNSTQLLSDISPIITAMLKLH